MRSNQIVVFTALSLEAAAVRALLPPEPDVEILPPGTIVERAELPGTGYTVCLVTMGPGTGEAAVIAERVISRTNPAAVLLVGVAGGLKGDVGLGDIVAGRRVMYHAGAKDAAHGLQARPEAWPASHLLLQLAQLVESRGSWQRFLRDEGAPNVYLKPIASGDVLKATDDSPLSRLLAESYNDAAAIEMEAAGVARAAQHHGVELLVIRGISDRSDQTKTSGGDTSWQPRAAHHAAAFALGLISALPAPAAEPAGATSSGPADSGSDRADEPDWTQLDHAPAVAWRTEMSHAYATETSTLELHLVPVGPDARVQAARMQTLWEELVQLGYAHRLFAYGQAVEGRGDVAHGALAHTRASRDTDTTGLAVLRTGQCSTWEALPTVEGLSVAVFDPADIAARLTRMLNLLLAYPVPLAARLVPVAAIAPDQLIMRSKVGVDHRGRASIRTVPSPLRTEATEAVSTERLRRTIEPVAEELAARLDLAFDVRRN